MLKGLCAPRPLLLLRSTSANPAHSPQADGTVVASYWVVSAPAFFGIATVYYIQLITFVRRHAHRKDTG